MINNNYDSCYHDWKIMSLSKDDQNRIVYQCVCRLCGEPDEMTTRPSKSGGRRWNKWLRGNRK
jgi:hypothetical protein